MQSPVNKENYINVLPPLGILYICSFLKSKDIPSDIIDYNVSNIDYSVVQDYDLIGFSINCANITNTLNMAKAIKKQYGKEIIVGGPQVTGDPTFFLDKDYIDGAVVGEGEHALYEYLIKGKVVPGLYLKEKNKKIVFGEPRPGNKNLDSLPFPAFDKIDIRKYNTVPKKRNPVSTIVTSRGCPFKCIFCFHSLGYSFRSRSAENIVDEIEWQVKNFGVKEICFLDDNLSLDINRAKKIFKGIIDKNLDVVFQIHNGIRVDKVDDELLSLMKQARLWFMIICPESGDSKTIELIKKGFDKEIVRKVVKTSKKMGFFTYACFMIGFPWETEERIKRTVDFAKELDTDMVQFSRVTAFPGTELYDMCNLNYKIEKDSGLFYGDPRFNISKLTDSRINQIIKEAYRKCYLKPRKILKLLTSLKWRNVYLLAKYSVTTKSI